MTDLLRNNLIMVLSKTVGRLVRQVMEWPGPCSDPAGE
jgi:hypothetical protein